MSVTIDEQIFLAGMRYVYVVIIFSYRKAHF